MPKQEIPLLNLSLCVSVREYRGSARRARGLNSTIKKSYTPKTMTAFSISAQKLPFLRQTLYITARKVQRTDNSKNIRSYFKFIPRQIEAYVEADGSRKARYAVNKGLLTKSGDSRYRQGAPIWLEHTCLK